MSANPPTKADRVEQLLRAGKSITEARLLVGCREDWAREVARKRNLPTNRPIHEGSALETQILTALVVHGYTGEPGANPETARQKAIADVAFVYRQTPDRIWDIINRKALS